jgi:copper ion binding protein
MKIDGMSCGHCVQSVKQALERLDGVKVTDVKVGRATVEYDETLASASEIAEAVSQAGYSASLATANS